MSSHDTVAEGHSQVVASTTDTSTIPCKYMQRFSKCRAGDACKFSHDIETPFISAFSSSRAPPAPCRYFMRDGTCPSGSRCHYTHPSPCRFFRKPGGCRDGDSCTYSHSPSSPSAFHDDRNKERLCRFFVRSGSCKDGDDCRFSHSTELASQAHEKPCHFFTRSGCLLGNTCPFPHVGESGAEPSSSAPAPNKPLAYSQTVCTYFASSGSCKFGKHCRLLHSDAPSRPGAVSGERVKMCHFMLNFGKCRLGDECGFSHLCTSFSRTGTCQYGDSCRFQHSSD